MTTPEHKASTDPYAHLHDESFASGFDAPSATAETMVFMGGRTVQPLDGNWGFVLDPFEEGLRQRWFDYDARPLSEWDMPRDYDFSPDWRAMPVPACWNTVEPELFHYEGAVWYWRDIDIAPPADGERVILRVGAANYLARAFLNGQLLGMHKGGSTPFFVDLTPALGADRNRLLIEVDSTRRLEQVPMSHFDWFNYGGLYREVSLIMVPATHIVDFGIGLDPATGRVRTDIALSKAVSGPAEVAIAGGPTLTLDVVKGRGQALVDWRPELWSPESPRLYDVAVRFGDDRVSDRVGFRAFAREGTRLLLNGAPVYFKGICVHEDDAERGKATSEADIRRRFADVKALGANAVRLAHYPHHEKVAEIADELGILLWEEIPVYWAIDFANPETYADAANQLSELIRRDRNRASVVIWGVGNENADSNARLSFMSRLAELARALDPTRLTAAACLINRTEFRVEDRLAEHLDIIGLNEYFGWYEKDFADFEKLLDNSFPDRPVVISETGADAVAGCHGPDTELFTEERQALLMGMQMDTIGARDYIAGVFPWILYDFRSLRRQTSVQRGWNRKGLIAEDKSTRKRAFEVLAERYAGIAHD
ncbi:MAG: glycoside hydrolase family 2 [Alphaproteobacteria bacterium]|nr:glycoside hydrolase family 2 [Alphaproteobacteria bacterium]